MLLLLLALLLLMVGAGAPPMYHGRFLKRRLRLQKLAEEAFQSEMTLEELMGIHREDLVDRLTFKH